MDDLNEVLQRALPILHESLKGKEKQTFQSFALHISTAFLNAANTEEEYRPAYHSLWSWIREAEFDDFEVSKKRRGK